MAVSLASSVLLPGLVAYLGLHKPHYSFFFWLQFWADCLHSERPLEPASHTNYTLDTVHVVYASDSKNFAGLLNSMLSLAQNLEEPSRCIIHLLVPEEDLSKAFLLKGCFGHEFVSPPAVEIQKTQPLGFEVRPLRDSVRPDLRLNQQAYARWYLHRYLPAAPRVVWLDTDTIIRTDISALYRMHMEHPLAAALDAPGWTHGRELEAALGEGLDPGLAHYFRHVEDRPLNSGVMVLDLERWRSGVITDELERLTVEFSGYRWDQLPLQLYFQDGFSVLDPRWNRLRLSSLPYGPLPRRCIDEAHILHWSHGSHKPWHSHGEDARGPHDHIFEAYKPRNQICAQIFKCGSGKNCANECR